MTDTLIPCSTLGYMSDQATFAVLALAMTAHAMIRLTDRISMARAHRDVRGIVTGVGTLAGAVTIGLSTVFAPGVWLSLYTFAMRLYAGQ